MKEYLDRFCTSFEEAEKLKQEIYAVKRKSNDMLWERIVYYALWVRKPEWYYEDDIPTKEEEETWENIDLLETEQMTIL